MRTLGESWAFPLDRLADEFLDRREVFLVAGPHQRERGASPSGAPCAADAMHVILGMMRNVVVEHVADGRNVEAAGCYVAGHQQRDFAAAERVEGRRAGALVHVAVKRRDIEPVLQQRPMDDDHIALAIAEHDARFADPSRR